MSGERWDPSRDALWLDEFTVTDEHLTLLRNAHVDWNDCEFGAPAINCKWPYGNSDVPRDIAELLHPDFAAMRQGAADDWLEDNEERLTRLHTETVLALQIALQTGEFRTGRYRRHPIRQSRWYRVDEPGVTR